MNDYFDRVETGLKQAMTRRAHMPWYVRLRLPARRRGLAVILIALVVVTPAVAAVGAVSGWFGPGKPDLGYPVSASSGLGKVIPGTRMLPLQVADPDGGPPWGLRLVKTTRGDTCVQVGRVEDGELGSLGIDSSWDNDHKFHPISPNDAVADVCGATDGAGHGFVSSSEHGWPASAFTPSDYGRGVAVSYCQSSDPGAWLKARLKRLPNGSQSRAQLEKALRREEAALARSKIPACPAGSLRMIFVGLLGPDAKSITYTTPSGQSKTEDTVGGVGAYLIVFKQTPANCDDYSHTLISGVGGCQDNYGRTGGSGLRLPNAVTSVTYKNGSTCSDQPSPSLAAAFKKFNAQSRLDKHQTGKQDRARFAKFLTAHHLTAKSWFKALVPQCPLVGWVAAKQPKVTAAQVASPIKFTVVESTRFCSNGPTGMPFKGKIIACDAAIPPGYRRFYEVPPGQPQSRQALVTASFRARQAVTTTNSWYEWLIDNPGNGGAGGGRTQADVRRGQQIRFTMFETANKTGVYRATVSFMPNAGQSGPQGLGFPGQDGSVVVGRFRFTLPLRGSARK
jgi:hypothetical protein